MAEVKISFKATVDDELLKDLESIVDHKLDQLIDIMSFPEIETIYDGEMEVLDE